MEKQRADRTVNIFCRLLIILSFASAVCAQSLSDIRRLQVTPPSGVIYTDTECMFTLVIPNVKPADVQVDNPILPSDVNFIALRRTDYTGQNNSTEVNVWLSFRETKVYALPPLRVRIARRLYEIPFAPVSVEQDPSATTPCLVMRFDNGVTVVDGDRYDSPLFSVRAGEKIRFTLYLQYAVQIVQFAWSVSKDALFTELERYEITAGNPRAAAFSAELIPVARFEWQPLVLGESVLPPMQLTATAYSGSRARLVPPEVKVTVLPSAEEQNAESDSNESYFSYAFTEVGSSETAKARLPISEADCETLAALRMRERHALIPLKAAAERRAFEKELGITSGQREPNFTLFVLLAFTTVIFIAVMCAMFAVKKRITAFVALGISCILLILTVFFGMQFLSQYGIFKGGAIRSVPDASSRIVSPIESGERVKIEENAGEWCYIAYGTTGGWILCDAIVLIK